MKKFMSNFEEVKADEQVKKRILAVSIMMFVFVLALILKPSDFHGKYITDDSGNVIGIQRGSLNKTEQYKLKLSVINDGKVSEREVEINKQANNQGNKEKVNKDNKEADREAEIDGIITDIELSKNKVIKFPARLSDGSSLVWHMEGKNYAQFLYIPFVYVLLILLIIKSRIDSKKNVDTERRKDILKSLPRFTNQLLLMLNSGMILSDAFDIIANSYKLIRNEDRGFFEKEVIRVAELNEDHRVSTAGLINEWANKHNVKELLRISTILTENEKRGSNVIDNLSRESRYLWDDRKIVAREAGKMIDTKMSYPMGILLLLLIVITMAPAMFNL